jgi:predicted O-methyltransferase YrrM
MPFQETTVGSMNYNVLRNLLKQGRVLELGFGAEIGVLSGDTSCHLLEEFPTLQMVCVDPWVAYDQYEPIRTADKMSDFEKIARERLGAYRERVMILKDFSLNAASRIPDRSLDFVFIDALHTYEAVRDDIRAWAPKVRAGGLVAGHDYNWEGVRAAVDEFAREKGISGFCTPLASDIWFYAQPDSRAA